MSCIEATCVKSFSYLEEAKEQGAEALVAASVLDALDATDVLDLDLRERKESPRFTTPLPKNKLLLKMVPQRFH